MAWRLGMPNRAHRSTAVRPHVSRVMCSARKLEGAHPARDLYQSERFRSARALVERDYQSWRILSGRHGFVHPLATIQAYDLDLASSSPLWKVYWKFRLVVQCLLWLRLRPPLVVDVFAEGDYLAGAAFAITVLGFRRNGDVEVGHDVRGQRWRRI